MFLKKSCRKNFWIINQIFLWPTNENLLKVRKITKSKCEMFCALLLFCWCWIRLCQLGSKQCNVYYMISNKGIKFCDFKLCFWLGFLWSRLCHLWYNKSQYPKLCLAYTDLQTCDLLVCIVSSWSKGRKTALCSSLCLITKSSLCNSFLGFKVWCIISWNSKPSLSCAILLNVEV